MKTLINCLLVLIVLFTLVENNFIKLMHFEKFVHRNADCSFRNLPTAKVHLCFQIAEKNVHDLISVLLLKLTLNLFLSEHLKCFVFFNDGINVEISTMIGTKPFIIISISFLTWNNILIEIITNIKEMEIFRKGMSRNLHLSTCNDVNKYTDYTVCPVSTCNDVNKYTDYTVCPVSTVNLLASYRPLLYMERPGSVFFIQLSSNGFFYPGRGLSVTCAGCDNSVDLIRFVSEPSSEVYHKTGCEFIRVDNSDVSTNGDVLHSSQCDHSPNTDYRTNIDVNNVVAGNSESTRTLSEHNQTNYEESSLTSLPSSGQTILSQLTSSQTSPALLSTQSNPTLRNAAYPVYGTWKKRMETLVNWPKGHIHSPTALADAGFFYAGYSDCVRCFYCGLGLRSWKPGDDIYVEHGRHRPTCSYLQTLLRNEQLNIDNTETVVPVTDEINNVTTSAQNEPDPILTSISDSSNSRMQEQQTEGLTQGTGARERSTSNSTAMTTETNHTSHLTERESLRGLTKSLLQRENQALKQLMKCKACNVAPIQDLFLPCGEMYTCKDCSNKFTHCPSCGKRILGTVKVYFT